MRVSWKTVGEVCCGVGEERCLLLWGSPSFLKGGGKSTLGSDFAVVDAKPRIPEIV